MSGGSYNYLYLLIDNEDIISYDKINNLKSMRNRLIELGFNDIANKISEILKSIEDIKQQIDCTADNFEKLEKVFKSVELYDSNDWDLEYVEKAIKEYREGNNNE